MFIRTETLSAHSAHLRKIPGWKVVVHEKFSVNKQATVEIALSGVVFVFFGKF